MLKSKDAWDMPYGAASLKTGRIFTLSDKFRELLEIPCKIPNEFLTSVMFYNDPDQRAFYIKQIMADKRVYRQPIKLVTCKGNIIAVRYTLELISPHIITARIV